MGLVTVPAEESWRNYCYQIFSHTVKMRCLGTLLGSFGSWIIRKYLLCFFSNHKNQAPRGVPKHLIFNSVAKITTNSRLCALSPRLQVWIASPPLLLNHPWYNNYLQLDAVHFNAFLISSTYLCLLIMVATGVISHVRIYSFWLSSCTVPSNQP